jgi:hypothetical protein
MIQDLAGGPSALTVPQFKELMNLGNSSAKGLKCAILHQGEGRDATPGPCLSKDFAVVATLQISMPKVRNDDT